MSVVSWTELPIFKEPRKRRVATLDGNETIQTLGYVEIKIIIGRFATNDEIEAKISAEFPGGDGEFVREEGDPRSQIHPGLLFFNCTLKGTRYVPS